MKFKQFLGGSVLLLLSLFSSHAVAQANVVETNETNVVYVSGSTGSDSNPGTQAKPFLTIQAAVNNAATANKIGIGTKILIEPGHYHELVSASGSFTKSLTIQAVAPNTVFIDGADAVTGFVRLNANIYRAPFVDEVSGCALPNKWPTLQPIVMANDMLFVNGDPYTQVMSYAQLHMGTFYIDTANELLYIFPKLNQYFEGATVEVTARRQTLHISGGKNIVLRDLWFLHGASCLNTSSVSVTSSSNVLIDGVTANWNNFGGIDIAGVTALTVQNTTASYNGGVGINPVTVQQAILTNDESDYNGWRTAMGAFYDFAMGGTKIFTSHGVTVNGLKSYNNTGEGLWFDTGNENITVENSLLDGNLIENMKFEASEGPFTATGNTLCNGGTGVLLSDAGSVTLKNNFFFGNGSTITDQNGQIYLAGASGGRKYTDPIANASEDSENTNDTIEDNVVVASSVGQHTFGTYLSGTEWSIFANSVISDENTWFDSASTTPFGVPGGKQMSFAGWQAYTTQDKNSTWTSEVASAACQIPTPSYDDYTILAFNSINYASSLSMVNGTLTIPLQAQNFNYVAFSDSSFSLSVMGLPTGVTGTFSQSWLHSGNVTLTLKATKTAKAQTVPITIFATSKDRVHSITININVTPSA